MRAELDRELVAGKAQSGMGLCGQGCESGSEEGGEVPERARNGNRSSTRPSSTKGNLAVVDSQHSREKTKCSG